jgi:hypothetical protein
MCSNMLVAACRQPRIEATSLRMTSIIELILKLLQGGTLQSLALSLRLGENQTKGALDAVVPTILGLFMKKAQEPGGAQSLHDTITKTAPGTATKCPRRY